MCLQIISKFNNVTIKRILLYSVLKLFPNLAALHSPGPWHGNRLMSKGAQQLKASDQLQQIAALPGSCVLTNFSMLRPAGEVVHIERTEDRGISISTNWSNRQT